MKHVFMFVLMGGITALANWPALLAHAPTNSKVRSI
jgi:hypothetical protein